jgi:hypothetical protein
MKFEGEQIGSTSAIPDNDNLIALTIVGGEVIERI